MTPSLEQLRGIHRPDDVSWYPLAPGWWLVILVTVLMLGLLLLFLRRRRASQQCRKLRINSIMAALATLEQENSLSDKEWLEQMSALLRRVAVNRQDRATVAGLVGRDWLAYLDQSGHTDQFTAGVGQVLATAPYQATVSFDRAALLRLSRSWLAIQADRGGHNA